MKLPSNPKQGDVFKTDDGFYFVYTNEGWVICGKTPPVNGKPDFESLLNDSWKDNEELYRSLK